MASYGIVAFVALAIGFVIGERSERKLCEIEIKLWRESSQRWLDTAMRLLAKVGEKNHG